MSALRAVHLAAGAVAYLAALACVLGVDRLAPDFWDWQEAAAPSRLAALRGIAVPTLLFAAGGTALMFAAALKRRFSPRIAGQYVMPETVWHSLGYLSCVLAAMVVLLLVEAS